MNIVDVTKKLRAAYPYPCHPHCLNKMCPKMHGKSFYTKRYVNANIHKYPEGLRKAIEFFVAYHAGPGYYK